MLLILIRIKGKVPVIMMGETGCGKTSLIKKLSQLLNGGDETKMKILNIHAGITNEIISDFLFKQKYNNNEKSIVDEAKNLEKKSEEVWVFFDEINTCNSLGLISEIFCKHSCNGEPLPENLVFIGACNPYRTKKDDKVDKVDKDDKADKVDKVDKVDKFDKVDKDDKSVGLKHKNDINKYSNLVYSVNPLPHCLLKFVINFGSLSQEDEEKYMDCIIKEAIESFYLNISEKESIFEKIWNLLGSRIFTKKNKENNLPKDKQNEIKYLFNMASEAVRKAHKFVRDINDVSSVSLREIFKFNLFYKSFKNYLSNKMKIEEEKNKKKGI